MRIDIFCNSEIAKDYVRYTVLLKILHLLTEHYYTISEPQNPEMENFVY